MNRLNSRVLCFLVRRLQTIGRDEPLQSVRTIVPDRGWGGHFHTFAVFLSTLTSTRWSVPLVAGIQERSNNKRRESLVIKTVFVPYTLYEVDNRNNIMGDK